MTMTTYDLDKALDDLRAEGHPEQCVLFWRDVFLAHAIEERWDHWEQPACAVCDERRRKKGMYV